MKRKVLILIVSRGVGGLEKRFAHLYKYLHSDDDGNSQLTFLVSKAQVDLMPAYKLPPTKSVHLKTFGVSKSGNKTENKALLRFIDYTLLMFQILTKYAWKRYDVVHFVTQSSLNFRRFLKADRKVFSFVQAGDVDPILKSGTYSGIIKAGYHIDCLSDDLKRLTLDLKVGNPAQIHASPCSFIDYSGTSIGDKKNIIVFLGRFDKNKGVEILLESLIEIYYATPPGFQIKILGHGPKDKEILGFIEQHKLKDRVFAGFEPNPLSILKESLIYMSLQSVENYPSQALIEAMACGNAIVATNVGLTHRMVTPDVGILINSKEELVKAVVKFSTDKELAKNAGRKGRDKMMKEFTVQRFTQYLLNEVYFGN